MSAAIREPVMLIDMPHSDDVEQINAAPQSCTHICKYNGRTVSFSLLDTPDFSYSVTKILSAPPAPHIKFFKNDFLEVSHLSLERLSKNLQRAKEANPRKTAMLITAVSVGLYGLAALLMYTLSPENTNFISAMLGLSYIYLNLKSQNIAAENLKEDFSFLPEEKRPRYSCITKSLSLLSSPLAGMLILLHKQWTKVPRLEHIFNTLSEIHEKNLYKAKQKFDQLLPETYLFYKESLPDIQNTLAIKVGGIERDLANMQQFQVRTYRGEEELELHLAHHKRAMEQLIAFQTFYQKFDPELPITE